MKHLLLSVIFIAMNIGTTESAPRNVFPFDGGWKFGKGDFKDAALAGFDDSSWKAVRLPHTWNNMDGQDGGTYYRGPGWYRKTFGLPEEYSGSSVFVRFGAAGFAADVFVNGKFVGQHEGGFAAFVFDITGFVDFGKENLIAVRVDNTAPDSSEELRIAPLSADFTMAGGLYRKASLIITGPVHISLTDYASPGVFIAQRNVGSASADIKLTTVLSNDLKTPAQVTVKFAVYDRENKLVLERQDVMDIGAGSQAELGREMTLNRPHLWNGKADPYLYKAVVSIYDKDKLVDSEEQPPGLRFYRVDPDSGFFLNGKHYELRGVALHEDKKNEGRAITDADRRSEMEDILDIGATMVRMAHYQYAQEMYRLCDERGIVVWTEIPLVNRVDDSKAFADNAEQQLKELIRQNYNHPSVLFWGIFNEIHNQKGPDPLSLVRRLNALAKREDPTRLTVAASDDEDSTNFVTDALGMNKYFGWYYGDADDLGPYLNKWHKEHPGRAIGVSEYGAGGSIFQHEELPARRPKTDGPWHPEEYQTRFHEISWEAIESRPFIWFSTLWNMYDFSSGYRNEGFQPGINDKGIVTQGHEIRKDAYYWYKVNWNHEPMVHISEKMFTVRDAPDVTVEVYSNAKEVELFVDGISLGKKSSGDHRFFWQGVALKRGENHVKATASTGGKEYSDECWWMCPDNGLK